MKKKSIKKNALFAIIKNFANIAFPIITFPYISRILNPDGIGKINFANSYIEYFIMLAGLGLGSYAGREVAKIRDDQTALNKMAREIILINLISTAISYILLFAIAFAVPKFTSYILIITICSSKVLFETLGLNWLYTAEEEYAYITIRSIFFQAVSVVCMFLFVKTEKDLNIYAAISVISTAGSNFCNMLYARKFINVFEKSKIELKKHLASSLIFFGSSIAGKIYATVDTMMLGILMNDSAIGFYSAANKIIHMILGVIGAAVVVMIPRCSYLVAKGELKEYHALLDKAFDVSALFSLPAAAGLFILSKPIILLFSGEKYIPAIIPMRILTIMLVLNSFTSVINSNILAPWRKEKYILLSQISAIVVNFILNLILIPKYSVAGAVIASVISQIVTILVSFFPSYRFIKKRCLFVSYLKYGFFTILMSIPVIALYLIIENIALKLVFCTIGGAITYFACLALTKNYLCESMFNAVKSKLRGKTK